RQSFGALVRYAAPAARLGMRFFNGRTDQDAPLRRSFHPAGRRRAAAGRVGHSRTQRSVSPRVGLLLTYERRSRDDRETRCCAPDDARVHARQRLARRRRRASSHSRRFTLAVMVFRFSAPMWLGFPLRAEQPEESHGDSLVQLTRFRCGAIARAAQRAREIFFTPRVPRTLNPFAKLRAGF